MALDLHSFLWGALYCYVKVLNNIFKYVYLVNRKLAAQLLVKASSHRSKQGLQKKQDCTVLGRGGVLVFDFWICDVRLSDKKNPFELRS
jgi:hypothetical protein